MFVLYTVNYLLLNGPWNGLQILVGLKCVLHTEQKMKLVLELARTGA